MKRSNTQSRDSHSSKRAKLEPQFPKLDQTDPAAARRIQQRRRQVAKGKNTAGYDAYVKKIPKHKRRLRDHTQPSTPDHTLDIPNKRWQGLVKAWRKALHQYDPPDLMQAFEEEAAVAAPETKTPAKQSPQTTSVQAKQLSEAVENGLLVDVSPTAGVSPATLVSQPDAASPDKQREPVLDELDEWDKARTEDDEFFLDEDDSDDDLI